MVMKKDGRKRDIKSKLVAAVCMLLVSCIMMVSSTYAWFTLSTAPEVTGITTAVGANGNLEMALLPSSGKTADIGNYQGSGDTQNVNNTWGNLVNLSTGYGLDKITLFPATLNGGYVDNTAINTEGMLNIPTYGADGRVSSMKTAALNKIYANGAFGADGYGVRAVGTSSGMSAREQAYRTAVSSGNSAANRSLTASENSMSMGGSTLASLAMKKATATAETTYTAAELNSLLSAFNLLTNEDKNGAFDYIEEALKQYVLAYAISNATDDNFAALAETIEKTELANLSTVTTLPGTMGTMITNLATAKGNVTTAQAGLVDLLDSTQADYDGVFEWSEFSTHVTVLGNADTMYLNGKLITYWLTSTETQNELVNDYASNGMTLTLKDGVYVDLADYCGTLETKVTLAEVSYGGLTVKNVNADMIAEMHTGVTEAYLSAAKTTVSGATFTGGTGGVISDYYGYIIDMAFRTNVAGSYLQLQTEVVDRVYADNTENQYTMGHGSSMSFDYSTDFGKDDVINLMSFVRVVFFDTNTADILGHGRLDSTTATDANNAVTMYLKLWDYTANDGKGDWATSNQLKQLEQNTATAISALVYLEGTEISNADIANATLSGTMNLQFSSSATLNPMEYGELRNPAASSSAATEYNVTVNGLAATGLKAEAGETYTLDLDNYLAEGKTVTGVTVTMGSQPVANAWNSEDNTVTIPNVNGDIDVTVTVTEATN